MSMINWYLMRTQEKSWFCKNKIWYDMIYLLTSIGLSPGGINTVHIYTQTIYGMTQNTQYIEQNNNLWESVPVPVLARFTLAFALQLRRNTENLSQGSRV
jgi:hypothetical protein